jgi:uncharacterized protein (TIGR03067 family)
MGKKPPGGGLQGSWQFTSLTVEGKATPASALAGSIITLERNRFQVESPDEAYAGTFTVDPQAAPATIDIDFTSGPAQGRCLGIYALEGDALTICLGLAGGPRPTAFDGAAGGQALETLRRAARPRGKPAVATAPLAPGDPAELAGIQGTWAMVSGVRDGKTLPRTFVEGARRTVTGDETTVVIDGQVFLRAKVSLDPSKTPRTLDYLLTAGPARGKLARQGGGELARRSPGGKTLAGPSGPARNFSSASTASKATV